MSTQTCESRNNDDDEPEEGEIQDDEGSLEDVSSDDEIYRSVKRKERGLYSRTSVPIRGQFGKPDAQIMQTVGRGMLRSSERNDTKLKKSQIRVKSGYRVMGEQDNYHESMLGHRASKELNQTISGKIHEKENKGKDSKKTHRGSSYHGSGSELRSAYHFSEHSESNFSSSASSKSMWRKNDVKEKYKKKRKNSKNNKFMCPLEEVCESQKKIGNDSCSVDEPLRAVVNLEGSTMSQLENEELSPSSVSSDIQILDVPVILPEVITICDSDDDLMSRNGGINNSENKVVKKEGNELQPAELEISLEKKDVEKNNTEDSEDHLKFLREAALKSSKPETCPNVNQDDEVLQLRLAALRSAIIRKCEERKKRGLTLSKTNKKSGNQQMMSISPLGSPNYSSSGDSSIRASGEIDHGVFSPFDFNVTTLSQDVTDPANDSEMDKIAAIDMELAESDEERESVYIDVGEDLFHVPVQEEMESNSINSCKIANEPLKSPLSEMNNVRIIYPPVDTVETQNCSPSYAAHDSSGGVLHDHVPSKGASCVHIQSGGTYDIGVQPSGVGHVHNPSHEAYNIHHMPSGGTSHLLVHKHTPFGGAKFVNASYGEADRIRVPSDGTSYSRTSTGYIIGDEEQPLVLDNSVSLSHRRFSFESGRMIVENCERNGNIIIEDKILPSVEVDSNNSNGEQNSNPVCGNIDVIDDLNSQFLQASENSIIFNVGSEINVNNEHGVVICKLGQSDHSLSPENRELDLDMMIVLDEIGESSNDNMPTCPPERVPYIEESNNGSNKNSQSNKDNGVGGDANILECFTPQNNSEVNMSSPRYNSINSRENVSTDSGNSVIYDESSISFEESTKRYPYNSKSGKFEDASYKNLDNPLRYFSAAIQNSSDEAPHENIHKSIRVLNKEIPNHEQKTIFADSPDSNDESSVINIDEYTRQEREISPQGKKVISADSQDSSDGGSYINVDESSSPEEEGEIQISQAQKIILANSQNPSVKFSYINIDESSKQESEVMNAMKVHSQDSSDGSSCVNVDDSTSQEGEITNSTQKIISEDAHNLHEKCSYVIAEESSSQEYEVSSPGKKNISFNSQNSNDKSSPVNIAKSKRLEASNKYNSDFEPNSSNLSDSQSVMIVFERNCEMLDESNAIGNTESTKMSSSEKEIGVSGKSLTNIKHNSKSILQHELLAVCERSTTGSPTPIRDTEDVEEPEDEDEENCDDFKSSLDLLLKEPTVISKYTIVDHEVEIVNNAEDGVVKDHNSQMLRGSSLKMLNSHLQSNNTEEMDRNSDSPESGTCVNESDIVTKNSLLSSVQSNTYTEIVLSSGSSKSDDTDCNDDALVKQTPQSSCVTTIPQISIVTSSPKRLSYPSRHSTLNMPGGKNNKIRVHESKVSGRFKINVPKLVINLGEDSDSGEDNESETVKSDLTSNRSESDASEELRGNTGSQSVSADFEKKLDLLLKRARLQQEVTGNDVKEILSQSGNLSESCQKKVVKLRALNLAATSKDNEGHNVHSDNPAAPSAHVKKVCPLSVQSFRNVPGKNTNIRVQTNNKIVISGNNVSASKTSSDKTAVDFYKSIRGKIKNVSSNNQPSSSRSSGVDIGLLPSSKQKEYIRLKRQLAQLAQKEQEVKMKDCTLRDTTSLAVKRNCVDELQLLTCADRSGNALKQITGIYSDKALLSRKFVRRGQGLALVSRTDLGKSRRIVSSVATSGNVLPVSRHRLAGTCPSRIKSASLEGAAVTDHAFGGLSKKIITNSSDVRKLASTGIKVSLFNANLNNSAKQQKVNSLPENFSVESVELQKEKSPLVMRNEVKEVVQEVQVNESVTVNKSQIQKSNCGKTVLKRKGNHSEHSGTILRKKIAIEEFSQEQAIDEHEVLNDLKNLSLHRVDKSLLSFNKNLQETCVETNKGLIKRKRTVSEGGRSTRWKPLVLHTTDKQTICTDDPNSKEIEILDRKIVEKLWNSESNLISKRYQVLQDIASVQMNLHKIESAKKLKLQIVREIERLKEEMSQAETQLNKEEDLLKVLYSEVQNARHDIMKKQSEQLLLSVECEELGSKVHGSIYSVPNICTDLIRTGMARLSKTLQDLKGVKKLKLNASNSCSSDEIVSEETIARSDFSENLESQDSEDSSKQIPGSYLSPLDALRITEPNNDNHAVLCPYQIMGTCKDKECLYQH